MVFGLELTLFGSVAFTVITVLLILGLFPLLGKILDSGIGLTAWIIVFITAIAVGIGLALTIPIYWGAGYGGWGGS